MGKYESEECWLCGDLDSDENPVTWTMCEECWLAAEDHEGKEICG